MKGKLLENKINETFILISTDTISLSSWANVTQEVYKGKEDHGLMDAMLLKKVDKKRRCLKRKGNQIEDKMEQ